MTIHRQVRIQHGDLSADVDEGLASLVLELWRRGFHTTGSCERQPGTTWAFIAFESEAQARTFSYMARGTFFEVTQEDYEGAVRDTGVADETFGMLGSPGVAFPAETITEVQERLRGRRGSG